MKLAKSVLGITSIALLAGLSTAHSQSQSTGVRVETPVWAAGPFDEGALVCYTTKPTQKIDCGLVFLKLVPAIETPAPAHCPGEKGNILLTADDGKHWCLRAPKAPHVDSPPQGKP